MARTKHLVVMLGNQMLFTSGLTRPQCTIGRLPDNDLVLPDSQVAPHHAEIRVTGERTVLTDLRSATGTVVSGYRLLPLQPHVLEDDARIQIGPYEVIFRAPVEESRVPEPVAAAGIVAMPVEWSPGGNGQMLRFKAGNGGPPAPIVAADGASRYVQFLPIIFQENDFLERFLSIFETIWEPLEQRQDHISLYFSPRTCPVSWLPWFATWFGLELNPHWPEARVRALLAEVPELYRWRGTKYGLTRMLEVCTGATIEIRELPDQPFVFHIAARMPPHADADAEQTLEELIKGHKPAHTGYVLEVQR